MRRRKILVKMGGNGLTHRPKGAGGSACWYVGNVKLRLNSADPEIDSVKLRRLPKCSYRSGDETISRIAANKGGYAVVAVDVKIYARS